MRDDDDDVFCEVLCVYTFPAAIEIDFGPFKKSFQRISDMLRGSPEKKQA
jgi:hypothetical protein